MKKIISLVVAMLLVGCGGSAEKADPTANGTPNEKGKAEQNYNADSNGKIKTIKLSGSAEDIAVSQKALFVAKGKDGIDIINIGYDNQVKSELITAIYYCNFWYKCKKC